MSLPAMTAVLLCIWQENNLTRTWLDFLRTQSVDRYRVEPGDKKTPITHPCVRGSSHCVVLVLWLTKYTRSLESTRLSAWGGGQAGNQRRGTLPGWRLPPVSRSGRSDLASASSDTLTTVVCGPPECCWTRLGHIWIPHCSPSTGWLHALR